MHASLRIRQLLLPSLPPLLAVAILGAQTGFAEAAWEPADTPAGIDLTQLSTPDATSVFAAGLSIEVDTSTAFPTAESTVEVLFSGDRGKSFIRMTSPRPPKQGFLPPTVGGLFFIDERKGWLAIDEDLYRTNDGGSTWESSSLSTHLRALHFFTDQRGVALGDGGTFLVTDSGADSWSSLPTPTGIDLRGIQRIDTQTFIVYGHDEEKPEEFDELLPRPQASVLMSTTNGGLTWTVLHDFGAVAITAVHFLPDGLHGYVATSDVRNDNDVQASLWHTEDGGTTFTPVALPSSFGELSVLGTSSDITLTWIRAMSWDSAGRGLIAGSAFLVQNEDSTAGRGSTVTETARYARVVEATTEDAGATWSPTDLGTIAVSLGGSPPDDGEMNAGLLLGWKLGWMAGTRGKLWVRDEGCDISATCGTGMMCSEGHCELDDSPTPPGENPGETPRGVPGESVDPGASSSSSEGGGCATIGSSLAILALALPRRRFLRRDRSDTTR